MRDYLIDLRNTKGLTQKDVSSKLGISESYYNLIEHGERQKNMNVRILYELAQVFKISIKKMVEKELDFMNKNKS